MAGRDAKGAGRGSGRHRRGGAVRPGTSRPAQKQSAGRPSSAAAAADAERSTALPAGPFRLGAIPGATPGKWISIWQERMPHNPLELVPLSVADQGTALLGGEVDAALVRLPLDREGLHVIPLYDEVPVVVVSAESHLVAGDELDTSDLAGEVLIVASDDVLGFRGEGTLAPPFDPPTTEEAIAIVAAGTGVVVVPMSLARLHHRRDVEHRPLRDGPGSTVALAWVAERTTPLVETFVGIVRGRSARSSRS